MTSIYFLRLSQLYLLSWKQAPARQWEEVLLNLQVAGSEPGEEGEEIAALAKENVATPWEILAKCVNMKQ